MAAPVPAGTYIITSVQYPDNAADLYGGNADGNIIGYPEHGKLNQQWELRYIGQSVYTFQSKYGSLPYAYTTVKGNTVATEYILFRVDGTTDQYKIVDNSDMDKGWTLTSANADTKITLSPDDGQDNQRWIFTAVE